MNKQTLTGAEILCEALIDNGVDCLFGIPGGVVLPFYDALLKYPSLRHILVRHEQAGGFAADAYARITKKPGVAISTSGPGATNFLTAIANAAIDSVPIVFITGQVSSKVLGSDAFQETDIIGMTFSAVKHSYAVFDAADIAPAIHEAFAIATHRRPGPVLIDITKDALQGSSYYQSKKNLAIALDIKLPPYDFKGNAQKLEQLLSDPETKPVAIIGHGVSLSGAAEEVKTFVERHHLPVVNTLLGVGSLPLSHPNALSMLGMHGEATANYVVSAANLVIGIGIRFDDRITGEISSFREGKRFVHIEIDPSEMNKNVTALLPFYGDAKAVIADLNRLITTPHTFSQWWKEINKLKSQYPIHQIEQKHTKWIAEKGLSSPYVIDRISQATRGNAIIVSDVGRGQMWVARYYDFQQKDSFLTSGGLGAMGYALAASMGAALAAPEREVWVICGDGGCQLNIQELATIKQEKMKLRIAVMNDSSFGIVRQWQQRLYDSRISHTTLEQLNFAAIAQAYGHGGTVVTTAEEIDDAIAEARTYPGTFVIDFRIDPDEHVYPFVPPLTPLNQQVLG